VNAVALGTRQTIHSKQEESSIRAQFEHERACMNSLRPGRNPSSALSGKSRKRKITSQHPGTSPSLRPVAITAPTGGGPAMRRCHPQHPVPLSEVHRCCKSKIRRTHSIPSLGRPMTPPSEMDTLRSDGHRCHANSMRNIGRTKTVHCASLKRRGGFAGGRGAFGGGYGRGGLGGRPVVEPHETYTARFR
jgi:hypothetical protein